MVTSELKETGSEPYKYLEERVFQAKGTVDAKTVGVRTYSACSKKSKEASMVEGGGQEQVGQGFVDPLRSELWTHL